MSLDSAPVNLTHHFLIAMPGLNDELFGRSVVYVCEHTPQGALGLIINKPSGITIDDLFQRLDLPLGRPEWAGMPVLRGGPLQTERGFVLHEDMGEPLPLLVAHPPRAVAESPAPTSAVPTLLQAAGAAPEADAPSSTEGAAASGRRPTVYASSLKVAGSGLELTTSRDVLEAVSAGAGPRQILITLGYASWGEGQLESELGDNAWLTVPADPALLFEVPLPERYERAMALLGLQPWMLAPGAGRA
ncbi:MAG: YqgE/AlgH family protein [Tepidimonas sp.]|uniref:YqgE/AlgH family protein n=1 Tax=Tepidimonas sp. TaxID=2002775 RepID=UPI00259DBD62|nr:YqgE/AlgH family protein [Tepidimonas sp.]MDM7457078.1 YqgE/AlgH family protein [Tepidimonas sp.]